MRRKGHGMVIGGVTVQKSTRSQTSNCLYKGENNGQVVVDNLQTGAIEFTAQVRTFTPGAWDTFLGGVKAGQFNLN